MANDTLIDTDVRRSPAQHLAAQMEAASVALSRSTARSARSRPSWMAASLRTRSSGLVSICRCWSTAPSFTGVATGAVSTGAAAAPGVATRTGWATTGTGSTTTGAGWRTTGAGATYTG